jgi:hypothetical protein
MKYTRSPAQEPRLVEDRLGFLVRLARMDLGALRPGDWLNLQEDVVAFLGAMRCPGAMPAPHPGLCGVRPIFSVMTDRNASFESLEKFQGLMREGQPGLHASLEGVAVDFDGTGGIDATAARQRKGSETSPSVEVTPTPLFTMVQGSTHDVFRWHIQRLLVEAPAGRVAHCRECRAIFYRVKRQIHCSRACSNRVSMRRFRSRRTSIHG